MRALAAVLATVFLAASLTSAASATPSPRMCSDLAAGTFTAEVLGDSIGAGIPGASSNSRRWQTRVAQWLPAGSAIWNGAVAGSSVRDYLPGGRYRFHTDFTLAVKPSVVILVFRTNDQWGSIPDPAGYSPAVFKQQLLQLVGEIRAASPNTTFVVGVVPWILDTRLDSGTYNQWDYIVSLWQVYVATGGIWMDWMRMMPKAGEPNDQGLLLNDLTHPSDTGQAVMAAGAYQVFDSYCQGVQS